VYTIAHSNNIIVASPRCHVKGNFLDMVETHIFFKMLLREVSIVTYTTRRYIVLYIYTFETFV